MPDIDASKVTVTTSDVTAEQQVQGNNRQTLEDAIRAMFVTNRAFIQQAKPGTAAGQASGAYDQAVAHSRHLNRIGRLLLNALDGVD